MRYSWGWGYDSSKTVKLTALLAVTTLEATAPANFRVFCDMWGGPVQCDGMTGLEVGAIRACDADCTREFKKRLPPPASTTTVVQGDVP